ncbi:MAG: hypothetical protein WAQ25_01845 [Candidatus Saccharimonas sp.]
MSHERIVPPVDSEERLFEQIAAIYIDPAITEILALIASYNEQLMERAVTAAQAYEIMQEVDNVFSVFKDQNTTVTGYFAVTSHFVPMEEKRVLFEDKVMYFGGALPIRVELIADDENHYQLGLLFVYTEPDEDGCLVPYQAVAMVEDIVKIDFDGTMSVGRARQVLEHYCPDVIKAIDAVLMAVTEDECQKIMLLRDITIILNTIPRIDTEQLKLIKTSIEVYIAGNIQLDKNVPYDIAVKGIGRLHRDELDTNELFDATFEALVIPQQILWDVDPSMQKGDLVPLLEFKLVGSSIELDNNDTLFMPLSAVERLTSLRRKYYNGK